MWSQDACQMAMNFAAEAHGEQKVPGKPYAYVVHLAHVCFEVMAAIQEDGRANADLAIQCALLHDTVEDAGVSYERLEARFGKAVADGVLALTKNRSLEKPERLRDSFRRIKMQPREIWMVKMADRIVNLQPPPESWSLEKRREYLAEAELILHELKDGSVAS